MVNLKIIKYNDSVNKTGIRLNFLFSGRRTFEIKYFRALRVDGNEIEI